MKVYIETYGCTFNKADSQIIAGVLCQNEIDIVDDYKVLRVVFNNGATYEYTNVDVNDYVKFLQKY